MHIYYTYHVFLAKHDFMEAPLPAGDEVASLIELKELTPPR